MNGGSEGLGQYEAIGDPPVHRSHKVIDYPRLALPTSFSLGYVFSFM